ncbi:MAG: hypothetical protein B6242_04475 [Anaerolineaceae bacterium 4572_78]|nr:MAG: hypothetical protein B6242_04475 [Anaerolineaceae bacterium 4572_78]
MLFGNEHGKLTHIVDLPCFDFGGGVVLWYNGFMIATDTFKRKFVFNSKKWRIIDLVVLVASCWSCYLLLKCLEH